MRRFTDLTATAAGIPEANVDTDQIFPGRFLKTVVRDGLGSFLFHGLRFDAAGNERPDFVLNRAPWRSARILVTLDNFGCGSSREHAPWALADFGIRAIIAPSFADIFRNNCVKNGILPIELDSSHVGQLIRLAADPSTATISISLPEQTVQGAGEALYHFAISPEDKEWLLLGIDEIAASEALLTDVAEFEAAATYPCPPIPRHFDFGQLGMRT